MKLPYIILLAVLSLVLLWLLWIISKPRVYRQLSAQQREELDAQLPPVAECSGGISTYTSLSEMFDTMMADIDGAQKRVYMEFFKFEDDATGRLVGDALARRAAAGVDCRLLYDDFVCHSWRGFYNSLRRQGVATAGFNPVHWPVPFKRDYYRTHRKIVVVDDRVAYLGGVNIADRYRHGLEWGRWRDTMIRIEGPAAVALERVFLADWCFSTKSTERLGVVDVPTGSGIPVRIIPSGPIGEGPAIMDFTVGLLNRAQHYIWFESPYFIPTPPIRQAMLGAARRGVDVRVLLPPRGDQGEFTQLASKSYFAEAMEAGIRIGHYQPGYMHSKIIVCDDTTAVVGSCNLDPRSHLLCQEVAAVMESSDYALQLKDVFLADEAQSAYVDPALWPERPCKQKILEKLTRLVSSQL